MDSFNILFTNSGREFTPPWENLWVRGLDNVTVQMFDSFRSPKC